MLNEKQSEKTKKQATEPPPLLEITDLCTYFFTREGTVKAVDGVNLTVQRGEIRGIVGESGCGKSMTAMSILRLVDKPGKIVSGQVRFKGNNLLDKSRREMTQIRGKQISVIFQEPKSSLNPVLKVGNQILEVLRIHDSIKHRDEDARSISLLKEVGIPDPEQRIDNYPHQMSGGMAQRVMIAMGMACAPDLLIADEPTTALDVTIQAQVLDLIRKLRDEHEMAVILITHDMGIVAEMTDNVTVMYCGTTVEEATTEELFEEPLHPYTQGLIASIPVMGKVKERLDVIPGMVPDLINMPSGCRFAPRCRARIEHQLDKCWHDEPGMIEAKAGHLVRCWLYEKDSLS
ncbi:MAG TPA: ABC transporter ATP-binding protein [Aggregatilineaceae bacterium]|nr:ABC transporter ATP-binding protein [Aggregatilineaceae bacterium]